MQRILDSLLQFMACFERIISVLFLPFVIIVFRSALSADAVVWCNGVICMPLFLFS